LDREKLRQDGYLEGIKYTSRVGGAVGSGTGYAAEGKTKGCTQVEESPGDTRYYKNEIEYYITWLFPCMKKRSSRTLASYVVSWVLAKLTYSQRAVTGLATAS